MYPCSVGIALRGGLDIGLAHEVLTHWGALWGDFSRSGGGPLGRMYPCSVGIALRGGLDIGLAHRDLGPLGRQVPNLVLPDLYTILTEWSASSPTPLSHNLLLSHLLSWVGNIKLS